MALAFRFPRKSFLEARLARECRCLKNLGCVDRDVYQVARRHKLDAAWLDAATIQTAVGEALRAGAPVLANVQLRALDYYFLTRDLERVFHSVLIVGMDDDNVVVHDPDPRGGPGRSATRAKFFTAWNPTSYSAYRV